MSDDLLARIDDVLAEDPAAALERWYDEIGDPWRGRTPDLGEVLDVVFPPGARDNVTAWEVPPPRREQLAVVPAQDVVAYTSTGGFYMDADGVEVCEHGKPVNRRCIACNLEWVQAMAASARFPWPFW